MKWSKQIGLQKTVKLIEFNHADSCDVPHLSADLNPTLFERSPSFNLCLVCFFPSSLPPLPSKVLLGSTAHCSMPPKH
jgi:hypothetical protein